MKSSKLIASRSVLLIALLAACDRAQPKPSIARHAEAAPAQTQAASARAFVQQFYDGYLPLALNAQHGPGWLSIADRTPPVLAPELVRALREDAAASAANDSEVVGLDFDPFLASQDPCERYEAGDATPSGSGYRVDVYGVCGGKRNDHPDVTPEVVPQNGSWIVVDFHYPGEDGDLLHVLRQLREDRSKNR